MTKQRAAPARRPVRMAGATVLILALGTWLTACGGSPTLPAAPAGTSDPPSMTSPPATPTAILVAPTATQLPSASATRPAVSGLVVGIDNFAFVPATLTVTVGTTVTWTNHDDVPHTVTSTDSQFAASQALDTGDHFTYSFTKPGTYAYFCSLHPHMTGSIIVH